MTSPDHPAIRHRGPCGPRRRCYRPDCRKQFGSYPTVEIVAGNVIAYCHRAVVPVDDIALRMLAA